MKDEVLKRLPALSPAELCGAFGILLSEPARALLAAAATHSVLLKQLIEAGHYTDAIRYLAQGLPVREAVWWGLLCARSAAGNGGGADAEALAKTEAWVRQPSDENARAAFRAAAAGTESAAGLVALAAFYAGDNIGEPGQAPIRPPRETGPSLVFGAVVLASVKGPPEQLEERYRSFLSQGIVIASGARP